MESSGLEKSGWVLKKAQVMPSWNSRYVVADPLKLRLKYYKDRPTNLNDRERGELPLTNCTVSVDASCNEDEFRFLITTADHKETFHLEVETEWERQEWIRIIRLISDLGVTKLQTMEEQKLQDAPNTLKIAAKTLLQTLDTQATESRKSLDRIAKQKWKAKCRLIELRDEMESKHKSLRQKQSEMKGQEKSYREELSHLNQALYVLQQQVRKSNEIQQQVVEIFGGTQEAGPQKSSKSESIQQMPILDKARTAVTLCQALLHNNYHHRQTLIGKANRQQAATPATTDHVIVGASTMGDERKDSESSPKKDSKLKKGRARSYSDLAVPKSAIFEDEMAKIIIDAFPDVITHEDGAAGTSGGGTGGGAEELKKYEDENMNIIRIFELYHRYYVEVHLPREMELIKVRTKCEQKYNSLRYVSNKKDLARREEDEIDWIMMEMKRAIDRLNREGVPLAPNEQKSDDEMIGVGGAMSAAQAKDNKNKAPSGKGKQKPRGKQEFQTPKPRGSSTMVPVLAHRSTWSEASDTIFQLNVARQQQYQATKDLEDSLKSREIVKSWYEDKIANA